ncbi:O-methyltransferase [Kineococcus gynurae]|uniref:O-methyltransferase n=1 Tax=Kineococcus gynurae TaxID=452979 RepID=A0ABV5LNF7_9ACTN
MTSSRDGAGPETWAEVDDYLTATLLPEDEVLELALDENAAAGLPAIDVSPLQGALLGMLARLVGARTVLEIGTLGGYSTIHLARALPADGRVVTCEYEPRHAEVAARNLAAAGMAGRVEIRVGAALDTLPGLREDVSAGRRPPFDLVFVDADKQNNVNYLTWALELTRPGSLIVVDNVVRAGRVLDESGTDPVVVGSRGVLEAMGAEDRLEVTALQMVGAKGWDGFALARVR